MKLHVLFVQRKERYEGEYAPEALAVADEYTMDDNPEWMDEQVEKHVTKYPDEFAGHAVLQIDLGPKAQERIRAILLGQHPAIPGAINEGA